MELQVVMHKCEPPETGYWAEIPALPGCVSEGETLDEAKAMIADAVRLWIESANDLAAAAVRKNSRSQECLEQVMA